MQNEKIDGELYRSMVRSGAANLYRNVAVVNELNVFPVPDGDTGDNMFLTIRAGTEAAGADEEMNLSVVAEKIATGMLLGARGNSGVILSRIFSGISKGLNGSESASVRVIGKAFEDSIEEAYSAVSKPVDGTILSVYRDSVRYANAHLTDESTMDSYFKDFICELHASLDRTPELLDVLKEAGVVDSGAAGLVYIAEGMKKALDGEEVTAAIAKSDNAAAPTDFAAFTEDSELTYGYCTEFLLRLQTKKCEEHPFSLNALIDYLNSVGNSVVAFNEGTIVKVHVHTMTPGDVMSHCQQYGEFLKLKIENMNLQHNETIGQEEEDARPKVKFHKKYGIVTVANGEGLKKLFKELGADEVIEGGQSMNPSAEDFLRAFKNLNADHILVLPNNSNIVATAKQAQGLFKAVPVYVLNTRTIGEGYGVLSSMNTTLPTVEEVLAEAEEAIESTVTGFVSKATRDSFMNGVEVREGDYIGFTNDEIRVDDKDRESTAAMLLEKLDASDYDIILLIRGQETSEAEADALKARVENEYPDAEVFLIEGLQPVYDYIMILE